MRLFIILVLLFFTKSLIAQDSLADVVDSTTIVLSYDTLGGLSMFNPDTITAHSERLVGIRGDNLIKDWYFYGVVVFSLILVVFYWGSRDIVSNSFKSFFSLYHNLQNSRTDRQSELFYFLIYLVLFVVGLTVVLHFILQNSFNSAASLSSIFLVCSAYFVWDYLTNNIYYLFSKNSRSIDLIKSISLSFSPIWTFVIWLAAFFVLLSSVQIAKVSAVVVLALLGILLLAKELRVLQVLWFEKINIISFHFFAYLCTFKILPFILLILVVFR